MTHTHQWFGGSSATTADILVTASGEYRVNVTELATTCVRSDTISFNFLEIPSVDLGPDTNFCDGDFGELSSPNTDSLYDFSWSTGSQSTSIFVQNPGHYSLEVANQMCVLMRIQFSLLFHQNQYQN